MYVCTRMYAYLCMRVQIFGDDGTEGGRLKFIHSGSLNRWFDLRTQDNSEVCACMCCILCVCLFVSFSVRPQFRV